MADYLQKVRAGQTYQLRADALNAWSEAAAAERRERFGGGRAAVQESFAQADIVKIRNDSGSARSRWDILALQSPLLTPGSAAFQRQVAFKGVPPLSTLGGKFGVLLEPVGAGRIGRAVVSGVTLARIQVDAGQEAYPCADMQTGSYRLRAANSGIEVLWKETGTGLKWGVIRLVRCGHSGSVTVVSNVTCVGSTLTVYKRILTYEYGLLTNVSNEF